MTLIFLVLVALPLYIWDTYVFLNGFFGSEKTLRNNNSDIAGLRNKTMPEFPPHYIRKGRSPFTPHTIPGNLSMNPARNTNKNSAVQPNSDPPPITITGIMWNPQKPVAITGFPDGSSIVVTKGQIVSGNIIIEEIEKTRVLIKYKNKNIWLKK